MNSKVVLALRIVFGLMLLMFGANKFFHFMPMGEMPEAANNYFGALMSTKTITLVAIVEIVAGLTLLANKYAALMMLILMSVSINAVMFHIFLDPAGIPMAAGLLIFNIVMLYVFKDKYKDLLNG